jgi:predicted tellurium resistance membrane protein TerC
MTILASTDRSQFVDLDVSVGAWLALLGVIVGLLAIDLYRHREAHAPTPREAATESIVWVVCALAFGGVIAATYGSAAFGEYISGYLIEKSLSIDNVFVWAMLFATLAIPLKYQHRVLFWGIFGALTLRAIFIVVGSALISQFWWLLVVFGVFLVYTGIKVIRHREDEGAKESTRGLKLLRRFIPVSGRARRAEVLHSHQRTARGDAVARRLFVVESPTSSSPSTRCRRSWRCRTSVHRVRIERVRHPRPTSDVLPPGQLPRSVPLPVARARGILIFVGLKMTLSTGCTSNYVAVSSCRCGCRDRFRAAARPVRFRRTRRHSPDAGGAMRARRPSSWGWDPDGGCLVGHSGQRRRLTIDSSRSSFIAFSSSCAGGR